MRDIDTVMAVSGGTVNMGHLQPHDLTPEKIAGPLSRINRFNGRPPENWSVAAHSVLVAHLVGRQGGDRKAQAAGLLHDAHEAILGDFTTPAVEFAGLHSQPFGPGIMKSCLDMAKASVDRAVSEATGVEFLPHLTLTKAADQAACEAELVRLLDWRGPCFSAPDLFAEAVAGLDALIDCGLHDAKAAMVAWLNHFRNLEDEGVLRRPLAPVAA